MCFSLFDTGSMAPDRDAPPENPPENSQENSQGRVASDTNAPPDTEAKEGSIVLAGISRTTWRPGVMYYITFEAQDPFNSNATTFQAEVQKKLKGPHKVYSCVIKT
ncbi:unnamed protein product [Vicia faba]|uniref:Uncharacterized protein n=1 Tax=Vicia faba TaxID=3906 RepID=A0AAV1AI17_VICFA|nr:unnamed protein product [Vicia faba]